MFTKSLIIGSKLVLFMTYVTVFPPLVLSIFWFYTFNCNIPFSHFSKLQSVHIECFPGT